MFQLARQMSLRSTSQFRLGCVIVDKNKVVAKGWNDMNKTHPKTPDPWKTLHAEIHAIIGVSAKDLKGCVAYVYRETKNGDIASSKPCPVCEKALAKAGIKRVYYTDSTGFKEYKL